jgi:putative FmdB family regulatory protein
MAIYDYRCLNENCCHRFEHIVSISKRDQEVECPQCKGKSTKRLVSMPTTIIAENDAPVSCKPDSYWDNAEEVRVNKKLKRLKENKEKKEYNDPTWKSSQFEK